jgi:hypothetical protein
LDFIHDYKVEPPNVCLDRGGGGKQLGDRLVAAGYKVRTVDFGAIKNEPKRGIRLFHQKKEVVEVKGAVKNRRSALYWGIRELLNRPLEDAAGVDDPLVVTALGGLARAVSGPAKLKVTSKPRFALPMEVVSTIRGPEPMCQELIRQVACVPLKYDEQGRFDLIPKEDPEDDPFKPENTKTFRYRIGRSPDIADAFSLAVHAWVEKPQQMHAGVG